MRWRVTERWKCTGYITSKWDMVFLSSFESVVSKLEKRSKNRASKKFVFDTRATAKERITRISSNNYNFLIFYHRLWYDEVGGSNCPKKTNPVNHNGYRVCFVFYRFLVSLDFPTVLPTSCCVCFCSVAMINLAMSGFFAAGGTPVPWKSYPAASPAAHQPVSLKKTVSTFSANRRRSSLLVWA